MQFIILNKPHKWIFIVCHSTMTLVCFLSTHFMSRLHSVRGFYVTLRFLRVVFSASKWSNPILWKWSVLSFVRLALKLIKLIHSKLNQELINCSQDKSCLYPRFFFCLHSETKQFPITKLISRITNNVHFARFLFVYYSRVERAHYWNSSIFVLAVWVVHERVFIDWKTLSLPSEWAKKKKHRNLHNKRLSSFILATNIAHIRGTWI